MTLSTEVEETVPLGVLFDSPLSGGETTELCRSELIQRFTSNIIIAVVVVFEHMT